MIDEHMEFASMLAHRLASRLPRRMDVEELESDAYLGLMQAAEGFDPDRKVLFRTYATRRIVGAMLDGLREREACRLVAKPRFCSLDVLITDENGQSVTLADLIPNRSDPVGVEAERREEVAAILRSLSPANRRDLTDYYLRDQQQDQIGRRLGISASAVSLRLRTICTRVRERRCRTHR